MVNVKRKFSLVLVFAMVVSILYGTSTNAIAASTITASDGNTYTYLGVAKYAPPYNYPVEGSLNQSISASDKVHLAFYCPNNNRRDLVQGTVTATPVLGGTAQTYSFLNYYNEIADINLSTLNGSGLYNISYKIESIGSSNQATIYYRIYTK